MGVDTHNVDFFSDFSTIRHVVGNHGALAKTLHVHACALRRAGIAEGLQNHLIGGVFQGIFAQCFAFGTRDIYDGSAPGVKVGTRNAHHIQGMGGVAFVPCFVHDGDEHGTTFSGRGVLPGTLKFLILCLSSRKKTI